MDERIAPDVATEKEKPLSPSEAIKREKEKYAESSLDENRDDQWDEHHGAPDEIP